jgi:hypothetical protein
MNVAEQLAEVRRWLEDAESGIARLADSASDADWTRRPPGGGWSAAECVTHLTMTNVSYLGLFAEARSRVPAGAPVPASYGRGIGGRALEWFLEPPYRARAKTIAEFVPKSDAPRTETIAQFRRSQQDLYDWIRSVEQVPLDTMMITSPFNAHLSYNAYAALRIIAAHERRHLWQAQRALQGIS